MKFTALAIRRAIEGVRATGEPVSAVTIGTDGSITIHTRAVDAPVEDAFEKWKREYDARKKREGR